ncbi:hypothetical protein GCM10010492_25100 [Saccharothrix mutabilis subsp. mutabilis]|uniref:RiboL-PSP-HEPN domain-containing protein n=1 Tax=Saccharothrix mutabilis subsp. mutabilis TaxID=66855 RepID=A0ABP3D849_9PSEU
MGTITWPPRQIDPLKAQLESLASTIQSPPKQLGDNETAWLTRFLVIRSCGFLEQVVIEVLRTYVREKSYGMVKSFATSHLDHMANPTAGNLCALVGRLDANLADALKTFLDENDQYYYRELAALVDKRHRIAHGLNEGVNQSKALTFKDVAVAISKWFIDNFDPRDGVAAKLKPKT